MQKTFSAIAMALALGVLGYASGAGAAVYRWSLIDGESGAACTAGDQLCLTAANGNAEWGGPGEEDIVLDKPVFVTDGGKLTILSGTNVRGNPRSAAVTAGEIGGTPGMIVVTRSGEVDWQGEGTPTGVIILTTAAVDNNSDFQPDDFDGNGFEDPYPGYSVSIAPCTCGDNATPGFVVDDCIGDDLILGTGDDDLGTCVLGAGLFHDDDPRGIGANLTDGDGDDGGPLAPLTPPIIPDPGLGPDGIDGSADDTGGEGNNALWGGVVVLGRAPTNTGGTSTAAVSDQGEDLVEGLVVPGWPEEFATFGGVEPHDSSGIIRYVSVRHAGDEIGLSNELNGFTMGAVGDGTVFEFNEVYANFDDGFEYFGGTVNSNHLVVSLIGDDSFDVDQGYSGAIQFAVSITGFFNEHDCNASNCGTGAGAVGSASGDKAGELDGDDCAGDCNQAGRDSLSAFQPAPTAANLLPAPTPVSAALFYNWTSIGNAPLTNKVAFVPDYEPNSECTAANVPFDCCTALDDGNCEAAANSGISFLNGFGGEIRNSVVVNTGTALGLDAVPAGGGAVGWTVADNLCAPETLFVTGQNGDTDEGTLIRVVASTFDDVAEVAGNWPQPNVAYTAGAPTTVGNGAGPPAALACTGNSTQALENGDAIHGTGVFGGGNLVNSTNGSVLDLADEDITFPPYGDAAGQLDNAGGTLKPALIDLRPQSATGFDAVISPGGHNVPDRAAGYRGAFEPGGTVWTDGWTTLSLGDLN